MRGQWIRLNKMAVHALGHAAMLLALMLLLSASAGMAVHSPAEETGPAEEAAAEAAAEAEEAPAKTAEERLAEPETEVIEAPEPWAPVPESPAVEDTYFSDAAFLGDSRTQGFFLYSGLKEGSGFYAVGATVESVFSKAAWEEPDGKRVPLLDALAEVECGKVYIMLGVNELGWTKVESFRERYAAVIDRVRADHPDAVIVLQSILPVSAAQEAKKSYVNNQRILVFNEAIMALAEEKDCPYVNVAEAVATEDGFLRADWNFDGVHLNPEGCRAWLAYLRTHTV